MKQINIKDKKPHDLEDILVWNGEAREIYLCYEKKHFEAYYKDVTHWMLLPEPPSEL